MTDCLFCKFVSGEIPANVVIETETTLAFRDINPQAPTHVLVVPKTHYATAAEMAATDAAATADVIDTARQVAEHDGLAGGYRLVFNTGSDAGQTVFHAHLHVLGGRDLGWPPG